MNFIKSDGAKFWQEKLNTLKNVVLESGPSSNWVKDNFTLSVLEIIVEHLEEDLQTLEAQAVFIFSTHIETESLTRESVDLLRRWHLEGRGVSLSALCIFALEYFGIQNHKDLIQAVLMASVLGEIPNDLEYHNNMHYRKVLFQTIRLIAVHNDIYAGTARVFSDRQIGLLLIAACIHDLGHDGTGNVVKGVFQQGRLERQAFELADPCLRAVGLSDEEALIAVKTMLLCTDVMPLNDPANFVKQMKSSYRFHYLGEKKKFESLNLDPELAALQDSPELSVMSLILHEADIATSAGLTYEVTKYETAILRQEVSKQNAYPHHVVDFLDHVCDRKMLSDAAQRLYAANMARIYALAEEDVKNGDQKLPKPEHSDFLISFGSGEDDDSSKTIN